MSHRITNKPISSFLVLVLLFSIILSIPLACASNHSSSDAMLHIGPLVNARMKALAVTTDPEGKTITNEIKAIRMADSLPTDFVPSEANTVSADNSRNPIYIFFDNTDDAGIMYFYTESKMIAMNPYSGYLFANLNSLTDISDISNWDTSNVTNMGGMFSGAKSLPDALAIRNWDTSSVTDMSYMFSNAISLKFIDVSNWNTSKVTNMTCMFQVGESWKANGQLIEILGLGDLDVSNVTDMTCMFYGAGQMTYYDVSRWNVSKVESMNHMFCDNRSLTSLDLSNWDVSSLKTVYDMFDDNVSLKTIGDVSRWNTVNLIDTGGWLDCAFSFVGNNEGTLDLSGWDTTNLKSAGGMFVGTALHTIDLSGWSFDAITNDRWKGAGQGFYYETGNDSEDLAGLGSMFREARQLVTVYVSQSGLDSFNTAVRNEINTLDMWTRTQTDHFTVK